MWSACYHTMFYKPVMHVLWSFCLLAWIGVVGCSRQDKVHRGTHVVKSTDGVSLMVLSVAPISQKYQYPMLMIHGGGPGALGAFDLPVKNGSLAADFARRGFKVYLMNIRGYEGSTLPDYDYTDSTLVVVSHNEAAQDIGAVVDWIIEKENMPKVSLFGWATGGHWAAGYAVSNPDKIAHLISLNSLYGIYAPWVFRQYFAAPNDSLRFNKRDRGFFRVSKPGSLTTRWLKSIPVEEKDAWCDPAVMEAYVRVNTSFQQDTTLRVPNGYQEESFYMSLGRRYWDARDIQIPTLMIRTEHDFWSRPEDIQALERELINTPRKRVITIPGTHYVFLDRPDRGRNRLLQEVTDFCR